MAGRLISTRIQAHVHHQSALILRRHDVEAAERVREVVRVERRLERLVDINTVGLELQSVHRLGHNRQEHALVGDHRRRVLVRRVDGVEGHSVVDHEVALGARRVVHDLISEQGQVVPVAVLVGVGR